MPEQRDIVQIKVDNYPIPDEVHRDLAFARVEQSVTLPERFDIQFYDPLFVNFDRNLFKLGSKVEIAFRAGNSFTTVTKGYITSVTIDVGRDTVDRLAVSGFDGSFKMTLEPHSQTFVKMSPDDVVKKIAAAHGLKTDVQKVPFQYEHVMQYNETDYDFLHGLAERIGYRVWVSDEVLHFREFPTTRGSTKRLEMGEELLKLSVRMSAAGRVDTAEARAWDIDKVTPLFASVADPGRATYAGNKLLDLVEKDMKNGFKKVETTIGHVPLDDKPQAEALAESIVRTGRAGQVVLKGEAIGSPDIVAGGKVEISGAGNSISGDYVLTSAEHVYGANISYVTRFTSGERQPSGLVDLLGGARRSPGNDYSPWGQLSIAQVTNLKDPENLGRVKVKFGSLKKEEESGWARLLSLGAGKGAGLLVMPEVGDTVLVGFEFGDPQHPIVLGGVLNKKDDPPKMFNDHLDDGAVKKRSWTSRLGHSVELFDGTSASDQKVVITNGKTKATVTMDDKGIGLKAEGKAGDVIVDASGDVEVKGKKVTVEATAGLELKGAKVNIEATGNMTLKGAQILLN